MGFWLANSANRMNGDRKGRACTIAAHLSSPWRGCIVPQKASSQLPDALLLVRLRSFPITIRFAHGLRRVNARQFNQRKALPNFHRFGCLLCSFSTWSIKSLHILMVDGLVGRRVGDGAVMTHFL